MKKVLIVEDEGSVLEILTEFFSLLGFSVREARDGEEALLALQEGPYTLFVLDVRLPKMDGFMLAEKIREQEPKTPIIFLTGLINEGTRERAQKIPYAYYLRKPVTFEELQKTLTTVGVFG